MFSLDLFDELNETEDSIDGINILSVSVSHMNIWKLMSVVISHLTWDVPVLHPTRSNVILILALPCNLEADGLIKFIQQTKISNNFNITLIHHKNTSAIVEFTTQYDADKFYVTMLGAPFDRRAPCITCIPLFIYKINSKIINILPMKTMKEAERREFILPNCPICFKLFDPLITSYFASVAPEEVGPEAYSSWGQPKCPACMAMFGDPSKIICKCGVAEQLWVCLDCGHVGCERNANQHAIQHFMESHHRFAFRRDRMWLWDYESDRTIDRSFHTRPSEASDDIIVSYKQMLIDGIRDLHALEEENIERIKKNSTKKEELRLKLAKLKEEEISLKEKYEAACCAEAKAQEIQDEITKIKKTPEMVQWGELESANQKLKARKRELDATQAAMFEKLDIRGDVSDSVVIDM